jgi:glutamine synthetase
MPALLMPATQPQIIGMTIAICIGRNRKLLVRSDRFQCADWLFNKALNDSIVEDTMSEKTLNLIKDSEARWVDLRFTDTKGKEQHVSIPIGEVGDDFFTEGKMFDGSSIAGWKGINESDMILMPDDSTAVLDPFTDEPTVIIRCGVVEPSTMQGYERDPRSIALRAEQYLNSTGLGDTAYFGPEPEFFVFDDIKWGADMSGNFYKINSDEAAWSSSAEMPDGNMGHRPGVKGGYFPVPPVDSLHDLRAAMCGAMEQMGLDIEVHHHEVGTAGQCEIGVRFDTLVAKADQVQILKYCVHNVAHAYGKTATFMPKPIVGDNGSGMHCHMSFSKDGDNQFAGDAYAGLSETALYYIGGIVKHAKALNAFANASTNSYKRLIPGFEAPVMLAYSARNRSAAIRIPYVSSPRGKRVEVRFGDPTANPYLMFASMLMAGLDGIKHKMHPGDSADKDLYDLPAEEAAAIPQVAGSLREALDELDADREFLTAGGVFTDDMIDAYIELKMEEVYRVEHTTHPVEFDMYYSC